MLTKILATLAKRMSNTNLQNVCRIIKQKQNKRNKNKSIEQVFVHGGVYGFCCPYHVPNIYFVISLFSYCMLDL